MGIDPGNVIECFAHLSDRAGMDCRIFPLQSRSFGRTCRRSVWDGSGIAHPVEAVSAVLKPLGGNKAIERLLRCHLIGAGAVCRVQEPVSGQIKGHQIVQERVSVFDKTGVVQRNSQLAQSYDNLDTALGILSPPRGKTAFAVLLLGHARQRFLRRPCHCWLILILGQRLQRHPCDVRVGYAVSGGCRRGSSEKAPPSVRQLALQYAVYVHLPGRLCLCPWVFRHGVISGVERNQRPDGAVKALPDGLVIVAQRFSQVISPHISGVLPNRAEGDNHPGILRIFLIVQLAVAGLHICLHSGIVVLIIAVRYIVPAPGQPQHSPFTADRPYLRILYGAVHIFCGILHRIVQGLFGYGRLCSRQQACGQGQGKHKCESALFPFLHMTESPSAFSSEGPAGFPQALSQ